MNDNKEKRDVVKLMNTINGIEEIFVLKSAQRRTRISAFPRSLSVAACAAIAVCVGVMLALQSQKNPSDVASHDTAVLQNLFVADASETSVVAYSTEEIQLDGTFVPCGTKMTIEAKRAAEDLTEGSVVTVTATHLVVTADADTVCILCDALIVDAFIFTNDSVTSTDFYMGYDNCFIRGGQSSSNSKLKRLKCDLREVE